MYNAVMSFDAVTHRLMLLTAVVAVYNAVMSFDAVTHRLMLLTVVVAVYNAVMSFDAVTHQLMLLQFCEKISRTLVNGLMKGRKSCLVMVHSGNDL